MVSEFEVVIGLEVHAQLNTSTKIFCADRNQFGDAPNQNISIVSLGMPGTLPAMNKAVIHKAIKLGLALNCDITRYNVFDRKNYFYVDLPKGYQITQDETPICTNGEITVHVSEDKRIRINRIHLEEDAGKSIHDNDPLNTMVDLNRAGVPLVEIVTEPDLRSAEEAGAYLTEIRKLVRHLDICDGHMEEGSLRCDANISIMPKGSSEYGTRVEIKNMNSIKNVQKAIKLEVKRQKMMIQNGERIIQETRSYDALNNISFPMREKEEANDYRYFTEPDLPPFIVTEEEIAAIQTTIGELPTDKIARYKRDYQLSAYDAQLMAKDKRTSDCFEATIGFTDEWKTVVNWISGPIKSAETATQTITPEVLAELIEMVNSKSISHNSATKQLLPALLESPDVSPKKLAESLNLLLSENNNLHLLAKSIVEQFPEKAKEYQNGKKGLIGFFLGQALKKDAVDPQEMKQELEKILAQ